ncbi:tetratricopeptide repeat protein [Hahella aquimaris]|uniref:tetratricopeptide repeat protein n=1 Tax=Hahella sp. HNIBRBA332 TaxID=3015983 RepID=UPI00273A90CA|nr:tetratricopeptide repeat protein [Hahella sp. HNIBRBA332]WLQ14628.1 tetratricopeptide repeat protein [Hahella sp. HNIBRBA332]
MLKYSRFCFLFLLALCFILVVVSVVYWRGLSGPFIFDDYPNLSPMNNYGGITSFDNLLRFLFETQGSSGRFISLLTFVVNDQAWPASAFDIKFTNLAFHLINSLLLILVVKQFMLLVYPGEKEEWLYGVAVIIALIWALHPLNVSTVLYAIQRMAQLASLFSLIALYAILRFCSTPARHYSLKEWIKVSTSFGIIMVVGIFAKENTFVAFFIAGCCISAFVSDPQAKKYKDAWLAIFVFIPLIFFSIFYFYYSSEVMSAAWVRRPFTLDERLLTEWRVVVDYIGLIVSPGSVGGGLYHDDYEISRSIFDPFSTLICGGIIVFLVSIAIAMRKKNPLFYMGVMWFFVGHVLESTFVPLELYFEHRNYFPMIGVLIAMLGLAYPLVKKNRLEWIVAIFSIILIFFEAFLTCQRASLWGDEGRLFYVWSKENPTSSRARAQYIGYLVKNGYLDAAKKEASDVKSSIPGLLSSHIIDIYVKCYSGEKVEAVEVNEAVAIAGHAGYENASYSMLRALSEYDEGEACDGFTRKEILMLFKSMGQNEKFVSGGLYASNYYYYLGELYSKMRILGPAMESLDRAYEHRENIAFPLTQAKWLADAGLIEDAYEYLDKAKNTQPQTRFIKVSDSDQVRSVGEYIKTKEMHWSSQADADSDKE